MNSALVIAWKDLRRLWPLATVLVLTLVGKEVCFASNLLALVGWSYNRDLPSLFFEALSVPVLFIFVTVLVHEDVVVGSRAFWRTRPIGKMALFWAKLGVMLVIAVAPVALAKLHTGVWLHAPWTEVISLTIEESVIMSATVFLFALVASMTRSLVQALLVFLGAILLVVLGEIVISRFVSDFHIPMPWDPSVPLPGPRVFCAIVLCGFCLFALAGLSYRGVSRLWLIPISALGILAALLTADRWTVGTKPDSPLGTANVSAREHLPFPEISLTGAVALDLPGRNAMAIEGTGPIIRTAALEEIVQGETAISVRSASGALGSKRNEASSLTPWMTSQTLRALGLDPGQQINYPVSVFRPRLIAETSSQGPVELSGELKAERFAFHEALRLPLRRGAEGGARSHTLVIDAVEFRPFRLRPATMRDADFSHSENPEIDLTLVHPAGFLSASSLGDGPWDRIGYFVIANPETRTFAPVVAISGRKAASGGLASVTRILRIPRCWHEGRWIKGTDMDARWFDGAVLVCLVRDRVGEETIAFGPFMVAPPPALRADSLSR